VQLDPFAAAYSQAVRDSEAVREWTSAAAAEPWVIERYEL
jgi:hypothetical protein